MKIQRNLQRSKIQYAYFWDFQKRILVDSLREMSHFQSSHKPRWKSKDRPLIWKCVIARVFKWFIQDICVYSRCYLITNHDDDVWQYKNTLNLDHLSKTLQRNIPENSAEWKERQRTDRKLPFPPTVLPDLWIEGHRPGQEVDPANHLTDYWQDVAMDDLKVDPDGQTRGERISHYTPSHIAGVVILNTAWTF